MTGLQQSIEIYAEERAPVGYSIVVEDETLDLPSMTGADAVLVTASGQRVPQTMVISEQAVGRLVLTHTFDAVGDETREVGVGRLLVSLLGPTGPRRLHPIKFTIKRY